MKTYLALLMSLDSVSVLTHTIRKPERKKKGLSFQGWGMVKGEGEVISFCRFVAANVHMVSYIQIHTLSVDLLELSSP